MEILASIITEIGKCLWVPLERKIGYFIHYKSNIVNLRNQVESLGPRRNDVQELVNAAHRSGEVTKDEVEVWLKSVNDIEEETSKLEDVVKENKRCFYGWCPNWSSNYKLGKEAKKKMLDINELKARGNFSSVSYPPPPPSIESMPTGDFVAFESTKLAMKQVTEALIEKKINMVGVYGMGGVGKTTLMAEVGKQMKNKKIFNEVVMVTISQNPDIKKIQGEIAEKLGLKLNEDSESVRASRLYARLKQEETILIILDDLWEILELSNVGFPFRDDHEGWKFVLITRSRSVCNRMNCQPIINVQILSEHDSWFLFKKNAGDLVESPNFYKLAKDVLKECGSLPLAIATVGRALRGRDDLRYWEDALIQLKSSITTNIDDVDKKVISSLMLSYNYLGNDEIKSCFLFCSLFPEDYNINMEVLMRYGIREGFCKNVNTLEKARGRLHTLLENLKASCLLLDGDREGCVKMHDLVRDVAINIVSKDGLDFFSRAGVGLTEWRKREKLEQCTRISLMSNKITMLPNQLECPKLSTLLLQKNYSLQEISDSFFEGMNSLVVLDLSRTKISALPSSLSYQTNLLTLCLDGCGRLTNISILKGLKKLEILSLCRCSITTFPEEIGELENLKLIDLTDCFKLEILPANVISRLSRLEELLMRNSFNKWELQGRGDGSKASLAEVASLQNLTVVHIYIKNVECLTQEIPGPWRNIKEFCISVGTMFFDAKAKRSMGLCVVDISGLVANWVKVLLERTEELFLASRDNFNFNNFFYLNERCYQGLKSLTIINCNKFKYLFLPSLVSEFKQLEELEVHNCKGMEVIIAEEEEGVGDVSVLPLLRKLHLHGLPSLSSFYQGQLFLDMSFLETIEVFECRNLKRLPLGPQNAPNLKEIVADRELLETLEWGDNSTKSRLQALVKTPSMKEVAKRCVSWSQFQFK